MKLTTAIADGTRFTVVRQVARSAAGLGADWTRLLVQKGSTTYALDVRRGRGRRPARAEACPLLRSDGSDVGEPIHVGDEPEHVMAALDFTTDDDGKLLPAEERAAATEMSEPPPAPTAEPRAPSARDRKMTFMRGWDRGASLRAHDEALRKHPTLAADYEAGYLAGARARGQAEREACERLGLDPATLMLRDEEGTST